MSRFPITWSRISPSPANRCWRTRDQVTPHSLRPHSAASAIRRSPGGSTPNSPRSRPDEPPLSATATAAVRSSTPSSPTSSRSADSEACSPWPPPKATTATARSLIGASLPAQVAVVGARLDVAVLQAADDLLGDGHAAVLPTGAADGHLCEPLAL